MSANYPGGEVPVAAGEFVGRQPELERIGALLTGTARMISLIGPGGIGKTRLATEALRRSIVGDERPMYWARLARLAPGSDAEAIAEEAVRAAANADITGRSAWTMLLDLFADAETTSPGAVLVLDNCEHVLTGVADLVEELLRAFPTVTILATSREPIGSRDEHILIVPPLFPRQSLELFLRRAERTGRPIADDPEQIAVAEQICRRVDHVPLFIQLAAARMMYQPPAMVLRELTGGPDDKRMQWAHGERIGMEQRHWGVRDVVAWSYRLCHPAEQKMLDRMAVFAAGFESDQDQTRGNGVELDAIVAVCSDVGSRGSASHISPEGAVRLLERLVERSLVSVHFTSTSARYYLQESVRVFVRTQLETRHDPHCELPELLHRLRLYYRERVLIGHAAWSDPSRQDWLEWARAAWDNILIAIESSLTDPDTAVTGLEIANELMLLKLHFHRGANRDLTQLAQRAIKLTGYADPPPAALRTSAMASIAWTALWQNRITYATELLNECVAECVDDPHVRHIWRGSTDVDVGLPPVVEFSWALELMLRLDPRGFTVFRRAYRKFTASGDLDGAHWCQQFEIFMHALFSPQAEAMTKARHHLEQAVASRNGWALSWAELAWTLVVSIHGDAREAIEIGNTALARHYEAGDTWNSSWVLGFRVIALGRIINECRTSGDDAGAHAFATQLGHILGGLSSQRRSAGLVMADRTVVNLYTALGIQAIQSVLGEQGYEEAERRGRGLRPELSELERYVLGILGRELAPRDRPVHTDSSHWPELSRAERDVALLAAAGWTNSAIAARRGSSTRTVDAQVAAIRQKLQIASRSEIAQQVPQELTERLQHESRRRPRRSG